jgi:sugar lactone lactonase YvrE
VRVPLLPFALFVVCSCHGAASPGPSHPSPASSTRTLPAPLEFRALSEHAAAAIEAHDDTTARAHLLELLERFGAHPGALWALGIVETHLGHLDAAVVRLRAYAAMGLTREGATTNRELSPLRGQAGWQALLEELARNNRPVSNATLGLRLPDEELVAEDVAWDAKARAFYVSAVRSREILAVRLDDGVATRFVKPGQDGIFSVLGLALDGPRGRLWATSTALPQADVFRPEDAGKTAIHLYDVASARLLARIDLPATAEAKHSLADVTLAANGDAYVADDDGARMYVAHAASNTLEPLDDGHTFISPQTPALSPDGTELFVPDYAEGIAAIDLATRKVRWLSHPPHAAVTGIDGLYFLDARTLLAVQNGTAPMRIVRLDLDEGRVRVTGLTVLEQRSALLGTPTHGVIVGDELWFIGRSGWEHMNDDGTVKPGESPRGSVLLRLRVRDR